MFLSKFLSAKNNTTTNLETVRQSWVDIQVYYETADACLRDDIQSTPIPTALQNIFKSIQAEELEFGGDNLETDRPCLEYLLQKRALEELVEYAKVDCPHGIRVHVLRLFCSLMTSSNTQLLGESAIHVPLQKLIASTYQLVTHHYEELEQNPEDCSQERHTAISELSLELVKLAHGVFSYLNGNKVALMDLFFLRGWCQGLGENVWKSGQDGQDGKTANKRRDSLDEKIQWNMFYLMPRFDMFNCLLDFMNIPGEIGEIARETILLALRLTDGDPEYAYYIVEYSGLFEFMAERLALLFALLPKNMGTFTIASNNRVVPVRPLRRRIQFSIPTMISGMDNAHNSFRHKRKEETAFDTSFIRILLGNNDTTTTSLVQHNENMGEMIVDTFYSFWKYMDDVARVADERLMTALVTQLTTKFWHPVVCTALSSSFIDAATAATGYTTEMVRKLTDQALLVAFLVVLVGKEGGIGKDLTLELKTILAKDELDDKRHQQHQVDDLTLRLLLIQRMDDDNNNLSLATSGLFDAILESYKRIEMMRKWWM
ncbi:unnamed protein product [Absidia cylindrospora]